MPCNPFSHSQQMVNDVLLAQKNNKELQTVCANCKTPIGYLVIVGVAPQMGDLSFCCEGCLEEFLDRTDDAETADEEERV